MSERKAELVEMRASAVTARGWCSSRRRAASSAIRVSCSPDTRGTAIMNRLFHNYAPFKGEIQARRNGVLISNEQGEAVAYAMFKLEDRAL